MCRNKPIETKNQSCQTETIDTETNLEALSTKVDQIFHKLNCVSTVLLILFNALFYFSIHK